MRGPGLLFLAISIIAALCLISVTISPSVAIGSQDQKKYNNVLKNDISPQSINGSKVPKI